MGKKLFDRNSKHLVVREILHTDIGDRLSRCFKVPIDLKDLMHNMLLRDVKRRFNSTSIKSHVFFKSVGNVSKGAVKKVFDPIATCKVKNVGPGPGPRAASPMSDSNHSDEKHVKEEVKVKANLVDVRNVAKYRESATTRDISRFSSESRLRDRWTKAAPSKVS